MTREGELPDEPASPEPPKPIKPPPKIRHRPLGSTGLEVSELALGTWGLSGEGYGEVAASDVEDTIKRAVELGITLFETSDAYEKGGMEERLGRLLEPYKEETWVITRHGVDRSVDPPRRRFSPRYLESSIARSRERLRRDAIDVLVLHNPSASGLVSSELVAFLDEQKQKKTIGAWGVSAGDSEVARLAMSGGAQVVELAYNALFSSDLQSVIGEARERNVALVAHSVLAYGLLVGMWPTSKEFAEGDHRRDRWTKDELADRLEQVGAVRTLLSSEVHTLRSASLRFVLENAAISAAVLGPRSVTQLEQLVREAGSGPPYLDADRLTRLPGKLEAVGVFL